MIKVEIIDPSHIFETDMALTIRRGIKSKAEVMRDAELGRIIDRTPYETGALQADETGTFNTDPNDPEIIHMFVDSANQMAEYNREYAKYVEGPDVGVDGMWASDIYNASGGTFTGWHMFGYAETRDIAMFEQYGLDGVQVGIDDIIAGNGARF